MKRTLINFHDRINRGEIPVPFVIITTDMGYRAYAAKELGKVFEVSGYLADGTYSADGTITAGTGIGVLEKSARLLSLGPVEQAIQPKTSGLPVAYTIKEQSIFSVTLNNGDKHFSEILPKEPFLGQTMDYYLGFEALSFSEHLKLWSGIISELELTSSELTIEAEEA